ncbi:MAG TPA: portal protein [Anaerohalosphaeraceae bacterium]|nr:portal protein [Anaerohalosphaeraceae bacterium]
MDLKKLYEKYLDRRSAREPWNLLLEEVARYCWPNAANFLVRETTDSASGGNAQTPVVATDIADATAIQASIRMAAGIISYLTPYGIRWFDFRVSEEKYNRDLALQKELSLQTQDVHAALWRSNFQREMFTACRQLAVFGTAVISVERSGNELVFRTYPIQSVYFEENSRGQIDTVYRRIEYNWRTFRQEFPEAELPRNVEKMLEEMDTFECIHAVFPNEEYNPEKLDSWAYKSVYFLPIGKMFVVRESGFSTLPYKIGRFERAPGELMGRSPAIELLPDIKMLNQMRRIYIQYSDLNTLPPLIVEEGTLLNNPMIAPGAILVKMPGSPDPVPLRTGSNIVLTDSMIQAERQRVLEGFYYDLFQALADYRNMTAYEVSQRMEEKLVMLSPLILGVQKEMLDPLILRARELIYESQPERLLRVGGRKVEIVYHGRLAMAMSASQVRAIDVWLNKWVPYQQFYPVLDVLNLDEAAIQSAIHGGVPAELVRMPDEIEQMRQERTEKENKMMEMQMLQQGAQAVKDLSPVLDKEENL